jgi:hypothetical protein
MKSNTCRNAKGLGLRLEFAPQRAIANHVKVPFSFWRSLQKQLGRVEKKIDPLYFFQPPDDTNVRAMGLSRAKATGLDLQP